VYVLDEPTTGLHMSDVDGLLGLLDRLVDAGNTVLVVEHNLDVVAHADWVIDLGPDGGKEGGRVVFEGTPGQLLDAEGSFTAEHLRRFVG
jgi:excinuclease UvrABC ATPase subunit